jgi:formate dehydrogenase major subunit
VAALGESYGRGAMTNHWIDLKNANVHLIMGSNAVENHPIASYHIWKAKEENNATIIHVDPRYTRTSAKADIYAPIRSGTDIVFLGGMVRWMIEKWIESGYTKYINKKYVEDCTNALFLVRADCKSARTAPTGTFTAGTWDYQYGADVGSPPIRTPLKVAGDLVLALSDPNSVFARLREHYSVYTPAMVQNVCGTPAGLFEEICEAYCGGTYADNTAGTMLYAMGWTQHTVGSQNIRAATLVQTMLGNIGVAGGGVDALRGWHNVQGATDHGFLMQYIPGYLALPQATADYATLGTGPLDVANTYLKMQTALAMDPDAPTDPRSSNWWGGTLFATQYNRARYMVSLLKAWWPSVDHNTSYDYLPKRTGDCSYLTIFDEMGKDPAPALPIEGLFCWGTNPAMMGPDQTKMRAALAKLDWMVVCDCFETETSSFWKAAAGVDPATINTEVYFLPGAYAYEKEGSASNSGRLIQWRDKACDPPGDHAGGYGAKDEVWILDQLGAAIIAADAGASAQLASLAWPAGPLLTGTTTEKIAKECNGYALAPFTSASGGVAYVAGEQLNTFFHTESTGTTACGNWLFCGTWQKALNARTGNYNQMRNRRNIDDHPKKIGIFRDWGYSWPVNRRIIYNRASVYQSGPNMGLPLNPDKPVVWWNPAGPNWDGGCAAGQANDVVDGFGTAGPQTYLPFIMLPEGVARLFGRGLADGPFPEHWEPKETPFTTNPLLTSQLSSPYLTGQAGYTATYATPGDPTYPIVCTTYRLTEHWHGGGFTRNCPTQGEAQPEPFVEMSEELASLKGIANGAMVTVTSARGSINLKACVTKRWKPFSINGMTVHEVGIPWHWGWAGMFPGATANFLTPFIGDANTRIPETKVFMVDVDPV